MKTLKRPYGILWLFLNIITFNLSTFYLGKLLKVYKKGAWYAKWQNWILGFFLGIIPGIIMLIIFNIQITALVSKKLEVPGKEIYAYPYAWIVSLIVPFIGWTMFLVLLIYTRFWHIIKIFEGKGVKFIK